MKNVLILSLALYSGLSALYGQEEESNIRWSNEALKEWVRKHHGEQDRHRETEVLQARNSTYFKTKAKAGPSQTVSRSTYKITAVDKVYMFACPDFAHHPVPYQIYDGVASLWSLMYRLYPYLKDKPLIWGGQRDEYAGIKIDCNLNKEILEVGFSSQVGFDGVPAEIFERLEAEVFEQGMRMEFDRKAFEERSCGSTVFAGGIFFDLRHYKSELWHRVESWYSQRQYPQMGSGTGNSPLDESHQDLLHQIIMWNIAFDSSGTINWDKYTFRYYHPTIIYRLLVDVGTGGYTKIGDSKVAYREGKYSHLLLPDDSRYIADRSERTSLMTLKNQRYYEILLDPVHLAEMSPEQFATELVSRLCQAYIAYELAIEGRIIPSVKAHLDAVNWYEGRFADLLAYYAEVKGLSLDALRATYVREQKEILLRVLYDSEPSELERLLWQTLGISK